MVSKACLLLTAMLVDLSWNITKISKMRNDPMLLPQYLIHSRKKKSRVGGYHKIITRETIAPHFDTFPLPSLCHDKKKNRGWVAKDHKP